MTKATVAILGALALSACGTMFRGTEQRVKLAVDPTDADVSVYRWSGERVVGPVRATGDVEVHRPQSMQPYLVVISRDGYCPRYVVAASHEDMGITFADIFMLGVIGAIVDQSTGGCCSVEPDPLRAALAGETSCAR